jgi:hypothetical protein
MMSELPHSTDAQISTLRTLIQGIAQNQERQDRQFREFQDETKRDISEIARAVNSMGKLSWPTILSVVTTSIAVGAILIAFVELRVDDLNESLDNIRENAVHHEALYSHPSAAGALARLEAETSNATVEVLALQAFKEQQIFRNGRVDTLVADHALKLTNRYSQYDDAQNSRLDALERTLQQIDTEQRARIMKVYGANPE